MARISGTYARQGNSSKAWRSLGSHLSDWTVNSVAMFANFCRGRKEVGRGRVVSWGLGVRIAGQQVAIGKWGSVKSQDCVGRNSAVLNHALWRYSCT